MNLVLDTNVILYHLANRLAAPLPEATISASIISEMEVRSYPTLTTTEEAALHHYLASLNLVELTVWTTFRPVISAIWMTCRRWSPRSNGRVSAFTRAISASLTMAAGPAPAWTLFSIKRRWVRCRARWKTRSRPMARTWMAF